MTSEDVKTSDPNENCVFALQRLKKELVKQKADFGHQR